MRDSKRQWNSLAALRDSADSRKLWETIFTEDSSTFLDYYDTWKVKENLIGTRRCGGRLVSMIHWNPYRVRMKDEIDDSYYVIAVATLPEYRHRGLMAGQLRDGMEVFRRDGVPFIFLMPASPDIYLPFDFRYIYDREVVNAERSGGESADLVIRPLHVSEWASAAALMQRRLVHHFQCCTVRDRAYVERTAWECRSEGGDMEGIFEGDRLIGVFSWWGEDKIEIREMILEEDWEPKAALVLSALRARWPEAEEVTSVAAGWSCEGEREPIIMARIVNLPIFLRTMTSAFEQDICIRVHDRYLKENDGMFCWNSGPEGSVLTPAEEREAQIDISIADMVTWLMGYGDLADTDAFATEEGAQFAANIEVVRGCFFPEIV